MELEKNAIEARLISDWLETRQTDWVRVSAHWKHMADERLRQQLINKLGMTLDTASDYTTGIIKKYRCKGWIR